MIKYLKNQILDLLIRINNGKWHNDSGVKILIQTNHSFRSENWDKLFSEDIFFSNGRAEIKFTNDRITFYKLFDEANFCFCFSLRKTAKLPNSKPKLLYFPVTGNDFLSGKMIPNNYIIETPAGISSQAIAEYVLAMVMSMNRNLQVVSKNQVFKNWDQQAIINYPFISIKEKKIGILGLGRNGTAIANLFGSVGCKVIACDSSFMDHPKISETYSIDRLDIFLSQCDVLILSLPLNETTANLIDEFKIQLLKSNTIVVNVGRGGVIDDTSLINAAKQGKIRGAILDVFRQEPLPRSHPFWKLKNIIVTPHIAGNINIFKYEIMQDFITKIKSVSHRQL